MAKINKNQTSKDDASSGAEASKKEVTKKKVQKKRKVDTESDNKVSKTSSKNPTITEMVTNALTTLKDRKGSSLTAIKTFITNNYGLEMTKARQTLLRKAMRTEFDEGRIRITNGDVDVIKFNMRFNLVRAQNSA